MSHPKHRHELSIITLAFRSTMRAATLRHLIEETILKEPLLNESYATGVDPSFFRVQGMSQHGDILISHCKFADPVGIRIAIRHRKGDQPLVDRLVAALGVDVEPVRPAGKGSGYPFEDRTVGHCMLDFSRLRGVRGVVVMPSAVESGLDCLWDDEKEVLGELRLIGTLAEVLVEGPDHQPKYRRAAQLMQKYEPVMTVYRDGRRLPLVHQAHLPSEDGTNVLRIHFARDRRDGAAVIGWVDEYDMCP